MEKGSKIYVAGHTGMLGSAIVNELKKEEYENLLLRTHSELDLRDQSSTRKFFMENNPQYIFLAAAKVGGIKANIEHPAEFLFDNLQIQSNVLNAAKDSGVNKLLFTGSNCIYPKNAPQPFEPSSLLTGPVEPTNESYALAKLCGIRMCQAYNKQYGTNFISVLPSSMYGPNDNFDPENSHVVAALISKIHRAKRTNADKIVLWGTGEPRREVMYSEDGARVALFLMKNYNSSEPINAGIGTDYSIRELASIIQGIIGFEGRIEFNASQPSGIERKLLDSSKINALGWKPSIPLEEGLRRTYNWFLSSL